MLPQCCRVSSFNFFKFCYIDFAHPATVQPPLASADGGALICKPATSYYSQPPYSRQRAPMITRKERNLATFLSFRPPSGHRERPTRVGGGCLGGKPWPKTPPPKGRKRAAVAATDSASKPEARFAVAWAGADPGEDCFPARAAINSPFLLGWSRRGGWGREGLLGAGS